MIPYEAYVFEFKDVTSRNPEGTKSFVLFTFSEYNWMCENYSNKPYILARTPYWVYHEWKDMLAINYSEDVEEV